MWSSQKTKTKKQTTHTKNDGASQAWWLSSRQISEFQTRWGLHCGALSQKEFTRPCPHTAGTLERAILRTWTIPEQKRNHCKSIGTLSNLERGPGWRDPVCCSWSMRTLSTHACINSSQILRIQGRIQKKKIKRKTYAKTRWVLKASPSFLILLRNYTFLK